MFSQYLRIYMEWSKLLDFMKILNNIDIKLKQTIYVYCSIAKINLSFRLGWTKRVKLPPKQVFAHNFQIMRNSNLHFDCQMWKIENLLHFLLTWLFFFIYIHIILYLITGENEFCFYKNVLQSIRIMIQIYKWKVLMRVQL